MQRAGQEDSDVSGANDASCGTSYRIALGAPLAEGGILSADLFVRLCYDADVRTTLDISDDAYYLAKAIARDQNRSLGRVVGDLILQSANGAKGAAIEMSDYGFPTFRCTRPVTSDDVKALSDED